MIIDLHCWHPHESRSFTSGNAQERHEKKVEVCCHCGEWKTTDSTFKAERDPEHGPHAPKIMKRFFHCVQPFAKECVGPVLGRKP